MLAPYARAFFFAIVRPTPRGSVTNRLPTKCCVGTGQRIVARPTLVPGRLAGSARTRWRLRLPEGRPADSPSLRNILADAAESDSRSPSPRFCRLVVGGLRHVLGNDLPQSGFGEQFIIPGRIFLPPRRDCV